LSRPNSKGRRGSAYGCEVVYVPLVAATATGQFFACITPQHCDPLQETLPAYGAVLANLGTIHAESTASDLSGYCLPAGTMPAACIWPRVRELTAVADGVVIGPVSTVPKATGSADCTVPNHAVVAIVVNSDIACVGIFVSERLSPQRGYRIVSSFAPLLGRSADTALTQLSTEGKPAVPLTPRELEKMEQLETLLREKAGHAWGHILNRVERLKGGRIGRTITNRFDRFQDRIITTCVRIYELDELRKFMRAEVAEEAARRVSLSLSRWTTRFAYNVVAYIALYIRHNVGTLVSKKRNVELRERMSLPEEEEGEGEFAGVQTQITWKSIPILKHVHGLDRVGLYRVEHVPDVEYYEGRTRIQVGRDGRSFWMDIAEIPKFLPADYLINFKKLKDLSVHKNLVTVWDYFIDQSHLHVIFRNESSLANEHVTYEDYAPMPRVTQRVMTYDTPHHVYPHDTRAIIIKGILHGVKVLNEAGFRPRGISTNDVGLLVAKGSGRMGGSSRYEDTILKAQVSDVMFADKLAVAPEEREWELKQDVLKLFDLVGRLMRFQVTSRLIKKIRAYKFRAPMAGVISRKTLIDTYKHFLLAFFVLTRDERQRLPGRAQRETGNYTLPSKYEDVVPSVLLSDYMMRVPDLPDLAYQSEPQMIDD